MVFEEIEQAYHTLTQGTKQYIVDFMSGQKETGLNLYLDESIYIEDYGYIKGLTQVDSGPVLFFTGGATESLEDHSTEVLMIIAAKLHRGRYDWLPN